ncbi:MAG: AI-2E family transporter [Kiritimatiellae bacterium]|nr:AI-2E family transporter [Kiritimatiellia bacterium]
MSFQNTERQRLNMLLFYAFVLLLAYLAYRILQPFLMPLVWAGILALCAQPLNKRLARWRGPAVAAAISTTAVALLLIVPAAVLTAAMLGEMSQALSGLQNALAGIRENEKLLAAWTWIEAHVPLPTPDEMKARLTDLAAKLTRYLAGQAGAILQGSSVFVFKLFVTLFALFFFLRDGRELGEVIRKLLPFDAKRKEELIGRTRDLVFAGTMATLAVAAAQGLAGGILFAILGIRAPIFWGAVMGFCALLPLFGTALVWGPAAVGLFIGGNWIRGLLLVVLGIAVVGGLDNFLRPALVSGKTRMNGLVVFISLLGGVAAFGFVGIVLGPVIAAAVISLLQLGAAEPEVPLGEK